MKDEILNYIKQNNGIEVPALQDKFNLSYMQSKDIIDGLISDGTLVFESGVKYVCVNKPVDTGKSESKAEYSENDSEELRQTERRKYLEARRQELIRRMMADMDNDDDNDDDDDDDDDDDEDESGDDEIITILGEESDNETLDPIALQALYYCIQRQSASTTLIQRKFSIGYIRSMKIIDWMESMGYITSSNGSTPRKVLLTEERFMELYGADSGDKKETNNAAGLREGVGNLCEVLKKVAEEKISETIISDEYLDKIKSIVGGELFEVYKSFCFSHICAKGLTFSDGEKAEFFIHHYGNVTELCDGGITAKRLQRKPGYGYKRTKNTLEKLTDGLMIRMDDRDQLLVDVSDLSKIPAMYYYFYWIIESLIA